jgi:hypothetical protein
VYRHDWVMFHHHLGGRDLGQGAYLEEIEIRDR